MAAALGLGSGKGSTAAAGSSNAAAMGCPFAGTGKALPPGHPPVPGMAAAAAAAPAQPAQPALPPALAETVCTMAERGGLGASQIAQILNLDEAAVEATIHPPAPAEGGVAPLPPALAEAARTMAARGVPIDQVAAMLRVDAAAVAAAVKPAAAGGDARGGAATAAGSGAYKLVGDPMQERLDGLLEEPAELCCPVTLVLLVDPVTAKDGFVYERTAAAALCTGDAGAFVSPMTREALPAEMAAAPEAREKAFHFRRERAGALLAFVEEAAERQQAEMAMGAIDRTAEYLAALPAEAVAMLATQAARSCDALLAIAHSADQPRGTWHAKPQQLRRVQALKLQVTSGGGGADLRSLTCLVCFDDYPALKGVECANGEGADRHFVCEECFSGHVEAAVEAGSIELFTRKGGVTCVHPECRAPPFSDGALAKALPEASFAKYTRAKEQVSEQRINRELEEGFAERLQRERERAGGAQREAIKEHIVDQILTLKCPRCRQAFADFSGCLALTCSRAGCGCGFCALCQEDCGNDAHAHIGRGCPLAQQVGVKPNEFFLNDEGEWERASSKARGLKLQAYLETLTESQRQHALADCANELAALNLRPADFGAADTAGPSVEPPRARRPVERPRRAVVAQRVR